MNDRIESLLWGNWRRILCLPIVLILLGILLFHWGKSLVVTAGEPDKLVVYAFSTQEECFMEGIFPAVQDAWKETTGQELLLEGKFGPSEILAEELSLGGDADLAIFSMERHISWLRVNELVRQSTKPRLIGWSPMVIVVRPELGSVIQDFPDLAMPGLFLIHADPGHSSAGQLAVSAELASRWLETTDFQDAARQMKDIWRNVHILAPSAEVAFDLFEMGIGDALVTYEQDALLALDHHSDLVITMPARTIVAQLAAIIVDKNVTLREREIANFIVDFLVSEEGQNILTEYHMRPYPLDIEQDIEKAQFFTETKLAEWFEGNSNYIVDYWKNQVLPELSMEKIYLVTDTGEQ